MFPQELCNAFSILHSNAPSHSWLHTQRCVESSLGLEDGKLLDVFYSFDQEPIASGSIAQVHKAILRNPDKIKYKRKPHHHKHNIHSSKNINSVSTSVSSGGGGVVQHSPIANEQNYKGGHLVAIKVRHPNVAQYINKDFRIFEILANIVDCIIPWINFRATMEQFSHTMAAQAHLDVEGHHLQVLNHNFRHCEYIGFPHPIFASKNVIIETFELGSIVSSYIEDYQTKCSGKEAHDLIPLKYSKFIVTKGLSSYLKMLLLDNLMHADLHPG